MPEPETKDPQSPSASNAAPTGQKDAKAAPGEPALPAVDFEAEVTVAKAEAAANYYKYMRAVADLENFRRRAVREKDELRTIATGRVLEDIFPVLDNLALAIGAAKQPNADLKSLVGGIDMVLSQLKSALSAHGLVELNPIGQPFDPHKEEAIAHEPSPDTKEEHVLRVVRTGYMLNGRLLRPASVVVSSGPAKKDENNPVI